MVNKNAAGVLSLWEAVMDCLKRGNSAEVKREGGRIVVVEIQRRVKVKETITTG
jgi:hypothetical protein